MFFVLSKILDLAVEPLTWVLVLTAVALRRSASRSPRPRRSLGALGGALVVLLVLGNPMVSNRLWWWLEGAAPEPAPSSEPYDGVVLLGGVVPHGFLGRAEAARYGDGVERLLVTYDLLRQGRARRAIITGGIAAPGADERVEATVLADQLVAWGIAPDRLIVDTEALNTRQNALEAARIARREGLHRLLLVTSAFHMPRAAGCFRAVDLPVDLLPVDRRAVEPARHPWHLAPRAEAFHESSEAVREWTGRAVYRVLGYSR